ncbi:MAG: hypothetical protein JO279_14005 [Verrucomicrobia bacterium]|nr:hypothetical protein [Verrucomicrobiota bacterium]MBV8378106.1 hypothetical protein [Verrucomicrobiota bacterium]
MCKMLRATRPFRLDETAGVYFTSGSSILAIDPPNQDHLLRILSEGQSFNPKFFPTLKMLPSQSEDPVLGCNAIDSADDNYLRLAGVFLMKAAGTNISTAERSIWKM